MRLTNPHNSILALLLILVYSPSALAAKRPTSFCKCICAGNSTIIPLDSVPSSPSPSPGTSGGSSSGSNSGLSLRNLNLLFRRESSLLSSLPTTTVSVSASASASPSPSPSPSPSKPPPRTGKRTCSTCNRSFCLSYNLPICSSTPESEIFTTCFQRDSLKDQLVVLIFIGATAGLLGWAALKPWVERFREGGGGGGGAGYTGLGGGSGGEGGGGRGRRGRREEGERVVRR